MASLDANPSHLFSNHGTDNNNIAIMNTSMYQEQNDEQSSWISAAQTNEESGDISALANHPVINRKVPIKSCNGCRQQKVTTIQISK
jgi:hypothetical protein